MQNLKKKLLRSWTRLQINGLLIKFKILLFHNNNNYNNKLIKIHINRIIFKFSIKKIPHEMINNKNNNNNKLNN